MSVVFGLLLACPEQLCAVCGPSETTLAIEILWAKRKYRAAPEQFLAVTNRERYICAMVWLPCVLSTFYSPCLHTERIASGHFCWPVAGLEWPLQIGEWRLFPDEELNT